VPERLLSVEKVTPHAATSFAAAQRMVRSLSVVATVQARRRSCLLQWPCPLRWMTEARTDSAVRVGRWHGVSQWSACPQSKGSMRRAAAIRLRMNPPKFISQAPRSPAGALCFVVIISGGLLVEAEDGLRGHAAPPRVVAS